MCLLTYINLMYVTRFSLSTLLYCSQIKEHSGHELALSLVEGLVDVHVHFRVCLFLRFAVHARAVRREDVIRSQIHAEGTNEANLKFLLLIISVFSINDMFLLKKVFPDIQFSTGHIQDRI